MDTVIIGAGMGGLCAAIGVAAQGVGVTVLEKNAVVGGKLGQWQQNGFTFDTGPHVLTMRWALDDVFACAGKRLDDYLTLRELPIICRYHFSDGTVFDADADPEQARRNLENFAPGDGLGFEKFLEYARKVTDATTEPFLKQDFGASVRGVPTLAQWRQLGAFIRLKPWRSLRQMVRECFEDSRLRDVFELYALYSGSHPAQASGIFATVADVQWRGKTYYVDGGLYRIAEALRRVGEGLGVCFRTETLIKEIWVEGQRARGVVLESGEKVRADTVVCNMDALTALAKFVPKSAQKRWTTRKVESLEPSTSAFLLLLGVRGAYESLAHHNCFMAESLAKEFASIFEEGCPADDPTIGVACQSVSDGTRAPAGYSNLFVMTNPPALGTTFDWARNAQAYRKIVLAKLERMGLTGLQKNIVVEQMWTPLDLQARYGAYRGALYGLSSNGWRQGFLRPPNVSPDVAGLYFVGGSTHPGGGLPLCALSGMNVAREIGGA